MPRRYQPSRLPIQRRRPGLERLEDRRLLASDWTDQFNSRDVNGDWLVAPVDALILINKINRDGSGLLPLPRPANTPSYDTNGDGRLAPVDVLAVVNTINNDTSGPLVTAALVNDTAAGGSTNDDLLTSDVRVWGQVNDATGIRTLRGTWNNQTLDVEFTRGGQYTFVPPAATDGSQDGPQTIRLVATDARGNSTTQTLNVMYDTTPPVPASLGLTAATDTGTSSTDGITNLVSPTAQLTIEAGAFVRLLLDGTQVGSETTGGSSQFPLPTLLEGEHTLQVVAEDSAGNVSPPSVPTTILVDLTSPTAALNVAAPVRSAIDTFELAFSEPVSSESTSAASYMVERQGSGALPLQQVVARPQNIAQLKLASPLDDGSYQVRVTAPPTDLAGNPLAGTTEFAFDVDRLTSIQRLSPAAGESLVSVTRETIVRFDNPIDPATVSEDAFYLIANGQRVEGQRVVSSTERFLTFFYDAPLPAATEVRIVVNGNLIRGRDGKLLDADRDGQPGGVATADFRTLPLTRIAGTNVFGFVRDSYSGQPIVGATIRVDAFPEANAVTDVNGRFELRDMPAPDFYVHIDGSTASSVPAGFAYPNVGKPFHSVPGQTVQLEMAGQPFDIYLPPMALSDVQDLSSSDATVVGFGAAGKAELAQMFPGVDPAMFDRMGVTIAPGAAVDEQGNAATQAIVIPVPPDRIPAPLPPNLNPSLVVSIQAPGATNFDVPASVSFPNLDGLAPGEKTLVMSFDHDAGRWVVNGTATVSDDGLSVVSDPGTGIAAPGWHILATLLGLDVEAKEYSCGEIGEAAATSVRKDAALMLNALSLGVELIDVGPGSLIGRIPLLGTAVDIGLDAIAFSLSVTADFVSAGEASFDNISYLTWAGGATSALASVNDAILINPLADPVLESIDAGVTALSVGSATWNAIKAKAEFFESLANCVADVAEDVAAVADQIGQVIDAGAELLDRAEQLYRSFRHWVVYASDTVALANDAPAEDPGTLGGIFRQIENIYTNGLDGLQTLSSSALGTFSTAFGHLQQQFRQVTGQFTSLVQRTTIPSVGAAIAVETSAGLVLRGFANREGIATFQVPPGEVVRITGHNPASNLRGEYNLPSTASERSLNFTLLLNDDPGEDLDLDGLDDVAEHTWGTLVDHPDSDNDGIGDLAEILQGLNPLDNRGFPTGIIASLPLSGEAKAVALEGSTLDASRQLAYVATGSHGLAIVDTSQFNNPIVLGQLDLPGDATDVAFDTARQLAVVAAGAGGLHLVDVSDPMQPVLVVSLAAAASQVEVFDGLAYVAVGPHVQSFDLATGQVLEQLSLGNDPLTGLAREGNLLLTMDDNNLLQAIELSTAGMVLRDSLALPHGGGRLFVGGGVAYVPAASYFRGGFATIDVSDPRQLTVISQSDVVSPFIGPGTFVVPNGSGLGLLLGQPGGQGVADVMDLSDLSETNELLTRFNLPAAPLDAALGSGIAFIADGTAGLQVVNFVPFDNQRQPPIVAIQTTAIDLDPDTAGTQVQEGTTVTILSDIRDDVQIRNVQLLLAGQTIANDVSFPFDFSVAVPRIAQQGTMLNVQLRATDTGGNSTDSAPLVLNIVPDTFAPAVVQVTPADGGRRFEGHRSVVVRFSEPMDAATLTAANLPLVALSNPTMPIAPQQIQLRRDGHEVQLTYPALAVDDYRLTIQTAHVTDRAGNPLLGDNLVSNFAVLEDRDPGDTLPTALDAGLLDAVFTLEERIGQDELGDPDLGDLIRFRLDEPRAVRLDLTNRTDGSQLRLIADLDGDELIEGGEVLRSTGTPGTGNLMIQQDLEAGEYFVQVLPYYNDDVTAYTLTVTPGTIIVPTTPYDPGETLPTALPLGTLSSTPVSYQDMYGVWDSQDYYKFTIGQPREVRIDLTGRREGGYMRLIADLNGNGTFDGGDELRSAGTPGSGDANITQDLEAGEYFVQVVRYYNDHITPYTLTVTPGTIIVPTTPYDPGETFDTALPLGTLASTAVSYQDMYGVWDTQDYYKFTIDQPREVRIDLTGRREGGYMRLIADLNGNGAFDGGDELRSAGTPGSGDANITQDLEAGEYFVQVVRYYNDHITPYTLTVTPGTIIVPTTPYDPGETFDTALPLGTLASTAVSYQDMYGVWDTQDYYKFTIDQPREVRIDLTGRREGGYMRLIADLNGNGMLDGSEELRNGGTPGSGDANITQDLEAGEYFVQVVRYYNDHITPYTLTVTPGTIIVPTTPYDPGETFDTALPLGTLNLTAVSYQDMYGVWDTEDYYKFTIDQPREVRIDLTGRKEGGYMRLIADLNGNGTFDGGEELRNGGTPGAGDANITQDLEAGEYFLQVVRYYTDHITPYMLTVTPGTIIVPTTPYDPGSTLGTALPLGTLTSTPVSYQDMYGVWDSVDVYRFTLSQQSEVQIDLTGRMEGGYMRLVADRNGNGMIDSGEEVRNAGTPGLGDAHITQELDAGDYFLVVSYYYFGHITAYLLTLAAQT